MSGRWQRRAQPLLGTLVEVGVWSGSVDGAGAFESAFACIREVQACLSRFLADSDVGRFEALAAGDHLVVRPATATVLGAAARLRDATDGVFDVTLGSAPEGWSCEGERLFKHDAAACFDLGGIGKGHAVDCAVQALAGCGVEAGWVNAGGDLRTFGAAELPVWLRDETRGGARFFASLQDGSFATSRFGPEGLSRLAGAPARQVHASVAAPSCLWADALTKVVAATGDARHPVLARYDATAWIH